MEATDRTVLEQENPRLRKRLAELDAAIQRHVEPITRLRRRIASLEKESSNSSKPPTSDPPSAAKHQPDPKARKNKRRRGRKRRQRVLLPAERLDLVRVHEDPWINPQPWERALDQSGER